MPTKKPTTIELLKKEIPDVGTDGFPYTIFKKLNTRPNQYCVEAHPKWYRWAFSFGPKASDRLQPKDMYIISQRKTPLAISYYYEMSTGMVGGKPKTANQLKNIFPSIEEKARKHFSNKMRRDGFDAVQINECLENIIYDTNQFPWKVNARLVVEETKAEVDHRLYLYELLSEIIKPLHKEFLKEKRKAASKAAQEELKRRREFQKRQDELSEKRKQRNNFINLLHSEIQSVELYGDTSKELLIELQKAVDPIIKKHKKLAEEKAKSKPKPKKRLVKKKKSPTKYFSGAKVRRQRRQLR